MPKSPKPKPQVRDYRHDDKTALLRPESGSQDMFPSASRKSPKTYRYDSSLAPELAWDEAWVRGEGERLIDEIINSDDLEKARKAAEKLKCLSRSFLQWTGKAERERIHVPTLPLFVHERLSTAAVLETLKRHRRDRKGTLDMFGESDKSIGEKIRGAYEHLNGWQNRLILGDSLQVMNSLLEYEGMGRQVQMVYMDPPYGIKFGGNFQPFVRKRDVKDGDDDSFTREPEMVQAYRDTWELGIHSWLTYMRDRLLLARELLTDSGSCFVQISDENVHLVRSVMDEVFGRENFVDFISYRTSAPLGSKYIPHITDYICWYAKNKTSVKFRRIFTRKEPGDGFELVETEGGDIKNIADLGRELKKEDRLFSSITLVAAGPNEKTIFPVEYAGKTWNPTSGRGWKTTKQGMENIRKKGRFYKSKTVLRYRYYLNDFPYKEITNSWLDMAGTSDKTYVVQTAEKVIQRCLLMTTDPGDLVFDPTCGSGTTAVVAEQWGRRWITTDVSRVPLALARQRLLTATYPYYQLKDQQRGPGGGFVYARKQNKKGEEIGGIVPHITLKSIANDEPPAEEVLVDKPETESNTTRISGPFCVEAVLPTPLSPEASGADELEIQEPVPAEIPDDEDDHIPRMIKVLQLSPVLHLPENKTLNLKNIHPPAKSLNLHAEGENAANGEAIAIVFGPANGAISERAVIEAGKEARHKNYACLLVIAFVIEPAARQTVEESETTFGLPAIYVQACTDLTMSDLLKNMRSSQIFSVVGLPDVELQKANEKAEDGGTLWQVTLSGLDVFDPATRKNQSQKGDDVPCWMVDPDYDGQCFRAGQVFFPRTEAWEAIRKAVSMDFDDTVWEHLRGTVSAPFRAGEQVAVRVIDDRGNELMVVKRIP
ncbi:MAG: site-specific DNA-methyltransferase [Nitrospira sp.]|nr:site-specific DNA-methyltransferase [Nitrospira sp.]